MFNTLPQLGGGGGGGGGEWEPRRIRVVMKHSREKNKKQEFFKREASKRNAKFVLGL